MQSKHTPGPWTFDKSGEVHAPASEKSDDGVVGFAIAGVYHGGAPSINTDPEAEANAALIASAPDLLAELRRLTGHVDELGRLTRSIDLGCHPDARNLVAALVAVIRLAEAGNHHAAIAKAEGR